MGSCFCDTEFELRTPRDDLISVREECSEHILQIEEPRLESSICQSGHVECEIRLEGSELVELIQYFLRKGITLEFYDDADSFLVRLIADFGYTHDDLLEDEIGNLLDEFFFILLVGDFCDDEHITPSFSLFHLDTSSHRDGSTTMGVCFENILFIIDHPGSRKIWTMDEVHEIFDRHCLGRLVSEKVEECVYDFRQVMWGNIRRHTDSDTHDAIEQKIREARREDTGLLLRSIIVICPINRFFIDILEHEFTEFCHLYFGISHRSSIIPIHRSEISLTIDERITHRKILCHTHHRFVDR